MFPNILTKFSSPAKEMGLLPSQFKKASTKAKITGPRVKMANPIKLGAIKE